MSKAGLSSEESSAYRYPSSALSEQTDPWSSFQAKMNRDIARDTARLSQLRQKAPPSLSSHTTSLRETVEAPSEIALETEKFQYRPGTAEVVELLVRKYRESGKVPRELLDRQSTEGLRCLVEKLVRGKVDSEGRDEQTSILPIEEEELGASATTNRSVPAVSPASLSSVLAVFSSYESQIAKLQTEMAALRAHNKHLEDALAALSEKQRVVQWTAQMQAKVAALVERVAILLSQNATLRAKENEGRRRGSDFGPRKALALLQGAMNDDIEPPLSPDELQILQVLLDLHSFRDAQRFDNYLAALLSKHDASQLASTLVKYIRFIEEEVVLRLRQEVLDLRVAQTTTQEVVHELMSERAKFEAEASALKTSLGELQRELERTTTRSQIELRRLQAEASLTASRKTYKPGDIRSCHEGLKSPRLSTSPFLTPRSRV